MSMTEIEALKAAIAQFEEALARVGAIAATNEKLVRAYRRQRVIITVLVVLMAVVIATGVVSVVTLVSLRNNTANDAARNAIATLDGCRERNQTNVVVRKRFDNFYTALDALGTTDQFHQFVTNLKDADTKLAVGVKDVDCNKNGAIDAPDYPTDGGP